MMLRGRQRPEAVQHRALWPGSREDDRLRAVGGAEGPGEQLGYLSGEIEAGKHNFHDSFIWKTVGGPKIPNQILETQAYV